MKTETQKLTWYDKMIASRKISAGNLAALQTQHQMKNVTEALTKTRPKAVAFDVNEHNWVTAFVAIIHGGLEKFVEAGKMLIERQQQDPDIKFKIHRECPDICLPFLDRLEMLGLGRMSERVFLLPGWQQQTVALLPPAMQEAITKTAVPVVKERNGEYVSQSKKLEEMTRQEFRQSINHSGVVPPKAQIQSIERHKAKIRAHEGRYMIEGAEVVFLAQCRMNASQLLDLAARLEAIKPDATVIETEIKRRQIAK